MYTATTNEMSLKKEQGRVYGKIRKKKRKTRKDIIVNN